MVISGGEREPSVNVLRGGSVLRLGITGLVLPGSFRWGGVLTIRGLVGLGTAVLLPLWLVRGGGSPLEIVRRPADPVSRGGEGVGEFPEVVSLSLRLGGLGLPSIVSDHMNIQF